MARLVYSVIASLDGYVADERGNFDWAAPGEDVHQAVNDLERSVGTYLYGRRLYQVMSVWQDLPDIEHQGDAMRDYAGIWQSADKLVFSTTLAAVSTPRTRLERSFDPHQVHAMVRGLDQDASIGGPTLAAHALRAGVVDEVHVFALPVVVGGGTACWPPRARLWFDLVDQTPFLDGTIHLHYRPRR